MNGGKTMRAIPKALEVETPKGLRVKVSIDKEWVESIAEEMTIEIEEVIEKYDSKIATELQDNMTVTITK